MRFLEIWVKETLKETFKETNYGSNYLDWFQHLLVPANDLVHSEGE